MLNREYVLVASLCKLECNFVVLHGHHIVCDVSLFKLELCGALSVKTEEAGGEHNTVLKVTLDLRFH